MNEIMVKKSKVEKWQLAKRGLNVNAYGDVVSISCKICQMSYDKVQTLIVDWFNYVTFFFFKTCICFFRMLNLFLELVFQAIILSFLLHH